ncbi:5-oxoprolinase subunit PxpA [Aquimarina algiphila]|uniref:5-oxoprolinase subunit PxpA n=1 Tax=Aquimarina algiphila TaxID=2047982 RepID=UPI002330A58B|nr:5-oxoprolinase subunit PxpA [Aquimarina algiphila]
MEEIIFNADVGEGAGFDAQIMPFISWCNIACGSHAGDQEEIQKTIRLASTHKVKIGAHPSYPDRENFGRVKMALAYDDLVKTIVAQIEEVKFYVDKKGEELHHVKPHGALYNEVVKNEEVASAVLEAINNIDKSLLIITSKKSKLSYLVKDKFRLKFEAFADRNYNDDLTLVSRSENEAVLTDVKQVFEHLKRMVLEDKVRTKKGEELPIFFDTICVHGDNPKSVDILKYLHQEFLKLNISIG